MAQRKCPDCGALVSDKASRCRYCGREGLRAPVMIWFVLFIFAVIFVCGILVTYGVFGK